MGQRRVPLFWSTLISLVVVYLLLKWAFPYLSMWIEGKSQPLPIPSSAMAMYLILALVGAVVYITVSDAQLWEFCRPLALLLRGDKGGLWVPVRWLVVVGLPLAVGWGVYAQTAPQISSPTAIRIQHPTIPGRFEHLQNPFRAPDDATVKQFIEEAKLGNIGFEEGRQRLAQKSIDDGRILYQVNCRPCHGTTADGAGPVAPGFRLRPVNFADPGTIATLVEGYAFWRVKEGGPGLPPEATPWDSAMPIWQTDLTDEQIWKIILAEYDTAGVGPRKPEKLGE